MNLNFNLGTMDIIILVVIIVGVIFGLLYWLNKKASQKLGDQQEIIQRSKQTTSIFVIDKKHSKITDVNMPKAVIENMPKFYKFLKLYFVQAKIGPQIMTLMCDKKVFKAIPLKKNIKVELAGIYIVNVVGMKTKEELKAIQKEKKEKNKKDKNDKKPNIKNK